MSNYRHNSDQISFMSSNTKYMDHKKVGLGKNNFKENFQLDFMKNSKHSWEEEELEITIVHY